MFWLETDKIPPTNQEEEEDLGVDESGGEGSKAEDEEEEGEDL